MGIFKFKHMARFRKNMLIGEEEMNFLFTQLHYPDGTGYFVTVTDKNKDMYSFDVKQVAKNNWRIVPKTTLPSWITNAEQQLADAITEARSRNFTLADSVLSF
jgi:hypothetical protein